MYNICIELEQYMTDDLNELNTKLPKKEPTIEEKIEYMREALAAAERAHATMLKAHARIEKERNANK